MKFTRYPVRKSSPTVCLVIPQHVHLIPQQKFSLIPQHAHLIPQQVGLGCVVGVRWGLIECTGLSCWLISGNYPTSTFNSPTRPAGRHLGVRKWLVRWSLCPLPLGPCRPSLRSYIPIPLFDDLHQFHTPAPHPSIRPCEVPCRSVTPSLIPKPSPPWREFLS